MLALVGFLIGAPTAIMRFPTVGADRIAFVHADQVWIAPRSGGVAEKITDVPGTKSCLHFDRSGKTLAFTSDGEGNESIFTLQLSDRKISRVTHQPHGAQLCDWTPDGQLLFMSSVYVPNDQGDWMQLFTVPSGGGLPKLLPLQAAADGAVSPDGKYVAFTECSSRRMAWKGNVGGNASDLWLFDRSAGTAKRITDWKGTDTFPMWHGRTLFFVSDAGPEGRLNLWQIGISTGKRRQLTHFNDFDIDDPSIGEDEIVFQKLGALFRYDIAKGISSPIEISLPDSATPPPAETHESVSSVSLADSGRIVLEAGGDIWITDPTGQNPRNLTDSDQIAERFPAVSPDGGEIAYTSDAASEYDLETISIDGGRPLRITHRANGFLNKPCWSPDSQKIAFSDNSGRLFIYFKSKAELIEADRDEWNHGLHPAWSPDSKLLAYSKTEATQMQSLWLYDTDTRRPIRLTAGRTKDDWPSFDRKGDFLYYTSARDLRGRIFDSIDTVNFVYPASGAIMAMPLRLDLSMPWAPRKPNAPTGGIDLNDIERRATIISAAPANDSELTCTDSSNLIYIDWTNPEPAVKLLNFEQVRTSRKLDPITLTAGDSYVLSPNGSKLLVRRHGGYAIVDLDAKETTERSLDLSGLTKEVAPSPAWKQMFADVWRFCRDYYYEKSLNGADWNAVRTRFEPLVVACRVRSELDYLLSQMVAEIHSSHCSFEPAPDRRHPDDRTGMLGVDFELANGAYRFKRIVDAPAWDSVARSVLRRPGLNIHEGDYLLAVNGKPVDTTVDPWAAFKGTSFTPTRMTISPKPTMGPESRDVTIAPTDDDNYVRGRSWIEEKRLYVAEKSGGRIGYVFIPDTFNYGADAFIRQFYNEYQKEALIIDDRWNGGGRMPDRFIEILRREPYWTGVRQNTKSSGAPSYAHSGPKCMLINGASKSGGDTLPAMFRKTKLGKLIGTPTMGARGGAGGSEPPPLVDGSRVLVPHVGFADAAGNWSLDLTGVRPDIFVLPNPANGDPQLDAAIDLMLRELKSRHR